MIYNPFCKKCGGGLNRDGIFEPWLDPYNVFIKEIDQMYYSYHTLLGFLWIDKKGGREAVSDMIFYHKECVPDNLLHLIPSPESIEDYLSTDTIGQKINIKISQKVANESRLPPPK